MFLRATPFTLLLWLHNQPVSVFADQPCVELSGPDAGLQICKVSLGEYAISVPDKSTNSPRTALPYFHGAGSSGPKAMQNRGIVRTFTDRGYVVLAPSGLKRPNSRFGPGWSFLPFRESQKDELALHSGDHGVPKGWAKMAIEWYEGLQ